MSCRCRPSCVVSWTSGLLVLVWYHCSSFTTRPPARLSPGRPASLKQLVRGRQLCVRECVWIGWGVGGGFSACNKTLRLYSFSKLGNSVALTSLAWFEYMVAIPESLTMRQWWILESVKKVYIRAVFKILFLRRSWFADQYPARSCVWWCQWVELASSTSAGGPPPPQGLPQLQATHTTADLPNWFMILDKSFLWFDTPEYYQGSTISDSC
jgi:hypothetical protein